MQHVSKSLIAVAMMLLIAIAIFSGVDRGEFRALLLIPFVLVLPGVALVAALFAGVSLSFEVGFLFSLGLSFATLILGGLLLHWLPGGIGRETLFIWIAAVSLGAMVIAYRRRRKAGHVRLPSLTMPFTLSEGMLVGAALTVTILAVLLARRPAPPVGVEGYTTLWMVPGESADDYRVHIGVQSLELATTEYELRIRFDGKDIKQWSPITLQPGEAWEMTFVLDPAQAYPAPFEAALYRLDVPGVAYRRVSLWPKQ